MNKPWIYVNSVQIYKGTDQTDIGGENEDEVTLNKLELSFSNVNTDYKYMEFAIVRFHGKEGQRVPEMTPEIVAGISERYIELYENISGESFDRADVSDITARIEKNVVEYLKSV